MKDWDIIGRLGETFVPTLVLGGRYDEATPLLTGTIHQGTPVSEWVIIELLRERLTAVQAKISGQSEPPPPEIVSLMDRLDKLIEKTNQEEPFSE